MLTPAAAADSAEGIALRRQAVVDANAFAQSSVGGWTDAFDDYIACALEESGYPRKLFYNMVSSLYEPFVSAPVRASGAPSAAALSLLQVRARERVFASLQGQFGAKQPGDVVMASQLLNAQTGQRDEYRMVIRLNDGQFPSHAAHFRVATQVRALGTHLHRCFVPPGETAASLPFVTLYNGRPEAACAACPLALPESDIVYGEYTAPGADVIYPAGTVLFYPRTFVPMLVRGAPPCDTPVFFVFKPCSAALLRGAVPVGRVLSCVPGTQPTAHDDGAPFTDSNAQPYDAAVLQCFEALCKGDKCASHHIDVVSVNAFVSL